MRSSVRAAAALAAALAVAVSLAGCLDIGREVERDDAPTPVVEPTPEPTPDPVFTNPAGVEVPEPGVLVSQGGDVQGSVRITTTAGVSLVEFSDLVVHGGSDDLRVRVAAGDVVRNPEGFWWVASDGAVDLGRLTIRDGIASVAFPTDTRPENFRAVTIFDRATGIALGSAQLRL